MTIQETRQILTKKAANWTDDQVADYLRRVDIQLDVLFDILLSNISNKKING